MRLGAVVTFTLLFFIKGEGRITPFPIQGFIDRNIRNSGRSVRREHTGTHCSPDILYILEGLYAHTGICYIGHVTPLQVTPALSEKLIFLPFVSVCKDPPYKVEESGYAGFILPIEVYFRNKVHF